MKNAVFPVILILFGAAWLARELGWFHQIHLVLAVGLIVLGIAILLGEGINRSTVVTGPFLIYVGAAWLIHDQALVPDQVLWPVGVIVLGVLLFVARLPSIPQTRPGTRRRDRDQTLP
ncbi:MAG: hypothetical protein ABSF50_08860 [Burkholderiaceae bacterium]|jgi:hypothetical protein